MKTFSPINIVREENVFEYNILNTAPSNKGYNMFRLILIHGVKNLFTNLSLPKIKQIGRIERLNGLEIKIINFFRRYHC